MTLAETASGECLLQTFPDLANSVIPLLREAKVKFRKPAEGPLTAQPSIEPSMREAFEQQFHKKGRGLVTVCVEVRNAEGEATCTGEYEWFVQAMRSP